MRNRRRTIACWTALAVGSVIAVIGIGACTASGGGSGDSGAGAAKEALPLGPASAPSPAARAGGGSGGGKADSFSADSGADLALISAKIRTADMTVSVKHGESVATKADQAEAIANGVGGEVDTDDRTTGKYPSATLLLRVPPEDLSTVLHDLSALGIEKARQLSTRDVTSRVADVTSRVASSRAAIARLRVLYQHAVKVSDVITIESELSNRESDLESLQAQQRALDAETSTAAITLSLVSAPPAKHKVVPVTHHHRSGFVGGLLNGWDAFARGAAWVATAVGAVLPFAVLLAVIALLIRVLWPRLRSPREPAATPPVAQ
jgi:hypothetical protein